MGAVTRFTRLFVWFSLRNMRRHPLHALIVLLGIALGAAVYTSVRLSVAVSLQSFQNSVNLLSGRAQQTLVRPGGRVPEGLIARLLACAQVTAVAPFASTYVQPSDGGDPFLLVGIDPVLDRAFRQWRAAVPSSGNGKMWLTLMRQPYSLVAGRALLTRWGWRPGQEVVLAHARRSVAFQIVGQLTDQGLALVEGGQVAICDIATFQEFTGTIGFLDRIDVRLSPGASPALLDTLAGTESGLTVRPASEFRRTGEGLIHAYELNLSVLSFASLFVGMFLVYSLVALNAASRRHEIAVLAATGASARLIFLLFLAEGAVLGAAGWLAAIPISSGLIRHLLTGVSQTISTLFVRVHVDRLLLDPAEIILSLGVTLLVSLLAALQPAREAMAVAPKEALATAVVDQSPAGRARRLWLMGWGVLALVLPISQLPAPQDLPLWGYLATLCLFVGFAMLAPRLLRGTGAWLTPLLRRISGTPAFLAGRYLNESGTRTAISVGALITAVALFTALVVMIHSFRGTVAEWVHETLSGDLFVTPKLASQNNFRETFAPQVAAGLRRVTGPVEMLPYRRFALQHPTGPYQLEVLPMKRFQHLGHFIWVAGQSKTALEQVAAGRGVLLSEVFANRTGLGMDDRYSARVDTFQVSAPVVGIVHDYRTHGGIVFADFSLLGVTPDAIGWSGVRFFWLAGAPRPGEGLAGLRRQVVTQCGGHLDMVSGETLRREILRIFDETFAVTSVLLLIALAVATLGIATTLAILVLERGHQLNIIFAVGGERAQIRWMILWEALLMVLAGEMAGLLCGFVLSWLLVYVVNRQSFGWTFVYQVDWPALALSLPLILGSAVFAALPALRRVFHLPPAVLLRER
jgi:putative ABC transport system permease protein